MKHHLYSQTENEHNRVRVQDKPLVASKRHQQKNQNDSAIKAEKELTSDILSIFTGLGLKDIKLHIIHNSPQLSASYNKDVAKYSGFNGLTIVCLEYKKDDGSVVKLFHYSVCHKGDNYSRLEGRLRAKSRMYSAILSSQTVDMLNNVKGYQPNFGLLSYPNHPNNPTKDDSYVTAKHILNWTIKHKLNKKYPSNDQEVLPPLYSYSEDFLLSKAKESLSSKYNLDIDSIKVSCEYIRKYYTNDSKLLSLNLLATSSFFNKLENPTKKLSDLGGYVVFVARAYSNQLEKEVLLATSSHCFDSDFFNKQVGRKICLSNLSKNKLTVYVLDEKHKDTKLKDMLVVLGESIINQPINLVLQEPELPTEG